MKSKVRQLLNRVHPNNNQNTRAKNKVQGKTAFSGMKKEYAKAIRAILLFFVLGILTNLEAKAQDSDSLKTEVLSEQLKAFNKKLDKILNQGKESDALGRFELVQDTIEAVFINTDTIPKRKRLNYIINKDQNKKNLLTQKNRVDSVKIYVKNGNVEEIWLFTHFFPNESKVPEIAIFTSQKQLNIDYFNKYSPGFLLTRLRNPNIHTVLSEVVRYSVHPDRRNFIPEDEVHVLVPNKKSFSETKIDTDLNSFLDYRIYSDALGLFGKKGNGLVQIEAKSRFFYNPTPISRGFYIFNFFEPSIRYSKFDSDFKYQEVDVNVGDPYYVDQTLFNQYSFLDLGLYISFIRMEIFQNSFDLLGLGVEYNYSDIMRNDDTEPQTLNGLAYYFGTKFKLLRYKNFAFDIGIRYYLQRIIGEDVIDTSTFYSYALTDFDLSYHPKDRPENKVFLRFKTFSDGIYPGFTQLQFGYSSKLKIGK